MCPSVPSFLHTPHSTFLWQYSLSGFSSDKDYEAAQAFFKVGLLFAWYMSRC